MGPGTLRDTFGAAYIERVNSIFNGTLSSSRQESCFTQVQPVNDCVIFRSALNRIIPYFI